MKNKIQLLICIALVYILIGFYYLNKSDNTDNPIIKIDNISKKDTIKLTRATIYNAVQSQCDSNPLITADGSYIDTNKLNKGELKWVALSQDLVKDKYKATVNPLFINGDFQFGDTIEIISQKHNHMNGRYIVKDVMNKRYTKSIDFLVAIQDNHKFGLGSDFLIIKN